MRVIQIKAICRILFVKKLGAQLHIFPKHSN